MSRAEQTRLPVAPLIAATRAENMGAAARVLGVPRRRLYQWQTDGVPYYRADELAARLGRLAFELWPDFETLPDYQHGYRHPSTIDPHDPFTTDQEQTA